jgi:dinuclear metal center YbgI/SA1388 family protein
MTQLMVRDVVAVLEELYPPQLQQEWDVCGLNVGSMNSSVKKILFTIDVTKSVVEQALVEKVDLIISHHPLLLHPVSLIAEQSAKGEIIAKLIRANIALFNAHTNADVAPDGVNDALVQVLGLVNSQPFNESKLGRVGELKQPLQLIDFAQVVKDALPKTQSKVLVSGDLKRQIHKVAVCGGAGDSLLSEVRQLAVDAYITADLRHHPAQDNKELLGPALISVSHWASEWPWLKKCEADLQVKLKNQGFEVVTLVSNINTDPWDISL